MVEYPTDIDLDGNKDVHLDSTNDLATTSGVEQLQQSVGIDVLDELQAFISGRLTGSNVGQLEERIRSGLDDDPQLESVRNVTITQFDRQTNTIDITVSTIKNEDFTLEVST